MQVLRHRDRIAPATLAVVSHGTAPQLAPWLERLGFEDLVVLADPQRELYARLELRTARWRLLFDLRGAVLVIRSLLRGQRPEQPEQDYEQLGADLVVAPGGRIAYLHRSKVPGDVPSIRRLRLEVARAAEP